MNEARQGLNLTDVLQQLAGRPALPTMTWLPRAFRKRWASLALDRLSQALDAAHRAAASKKDASLEAAAVHASRLLWCLPGLLLHAEAADPDEVEHALAKRHVSAMRRRFAMAEKGDWLTLVIEALQRRHDDEGERLSDEAQHSVQAQRRKLLGRAAAKTRGGCLRTAVQLLTGHGKAGATQQTLDEVWRLTCAPPHETDDAAEQAAKKVARQAKWTRIPRRVVKQRVFAARAAAEPGPSGWRNSHTLILLDLPNALPLLAGWCQAWSDGVMPPAVGELWGQAMIVTPWKDEQHSGLRPIALQEGLLKLVEGSLRVVLQKELGKALPTSQMGVGMAASAQHAAELLQAAAEQHSTEAMLSLDVANAFGTVRRSALWLTLSRRLPQFLPYLLSTWSGGGLRLWCRGPEGWERRTATTGIPQGSPLSPELFAMVLAAAMEDELCPDRPPQQQQ